ncbi:MAG: type IV secretion system protein, partial [Candidatus Kerfeldbacteria bacterium]|nr:type IV secretion system protein [Candidatus Kerfeldbacteria bacterium]
MNFIQKHRRPLSALLVAAVIVATATLVPHTVRADAGEVLASWLAQLGYYLIQFFANLLVVVINILVAVAQSNDFLAAPAVTKGWVIVRDVSNMFFIVVLLIIAFGTILKLENYRYNRLLARLIVMAILVNFSKFIAGFFIDFAQVVMLTFVNAWRDVAAGNITTSLGLKQIVSIAQSGDSISVEANEGAVLTAVMLGLFLVAVATIVMSIIAIVLILRILALWFLIVLSPLAYLLRTYPSTEKYAARWWSEFGKYVVTGPVVAFLLWLSLAIMAQSGNNLSDQVLKTEINRETGESGQVIRDIGSNSGTASQISAAITEIGQSERLLSYITGIMLLVGTLVITKELGVAGGQLAGSWAEKLKGFGTKAAIVGGAGAAFGAAGLGAALGGRKAVQLATSGIKAGAGFGGRKLDEWSIRAQQGEGPLAGAFRGLGKTRVGQFLKQHPVSLRPSMVKKAYQEYRHAREEGVYGKAQGGMRDLFNLATSGGKKRTNYAYLAESRETKARESELRQGATRKEAMLNEMKSIVDFERDADGKIVGAKIRSGESARFQAAMHIMTQNHDINEIIKDADFGQLLQSLAPEGDEHLAQTVGPTAVRRLLKHMFGDHEGAEVGQDLSEIGLTYNDPWLYTLIEMNKQGHYQFIDEETEAAKDGKNYAELERYNAADHDGQSWAEFSQTLSDDDKKNYRDHYDQETDAKRGSILAAYNQKRENRRIATLARRQDFAPEVGFGDGRMYFRRELGGLGERLVRDVLSTMVDYKYSSPETKEMFQQRLDVLKAFADSAVDGGESYKKMTGGVGPSMKVSEDQRKGMYRLIAMILGNEQREAEKMADDPNANSAKLDGMISQYHGGLADSGRTKFAEYELRLNQLIEANRFSDSATGRQGFDSLGSEEQDLLYERLQEQAAREAGIVDESGRGVAPKLAAP